MLLKPFSEKLKQLRGAVGLTQTELAEALETTRVRISVIERGYRRATRKEIEAIARILQSTIDSVIGGTDWSAEASLDPSPAALKSLGVISPIPRQPQFTFEEKLKAAWKLNPRLVRDLERQIAARQNFKELSRFLRDLWVDSGPETFLWSRLGASDTYPVRLTLPALGLRECPIICPATSLVIGDVPRDGLWLKSPISAVFFPQVTLKLGSRPQRVDCMVCFGANRWIVIEIDGAAHNTRWDELRERDLKWPLLRLTVSDVQDPKLVGRIVKKFGEAFPLLKSA